jgi:hypothetical protein
MLDIRKLAGKLRQSEDKIKEFFQSGEKTLENYKKILSKIRQENYETLRSAAEENQNCEVIPSKEYEKAKGLASTELRKNWTSYEQSFKWAIEILKERVTFGVDGSQDYFAKELNLPIAVLQVGWYKNQHTVNGEFEKNAEPILIFPDEIIKNQSKEISAESYIGQRRFEMEIEKTKEFLESKKDWKEKGERVPVAFFDGAFMISLARRNIQESLLDSVIELVKLSAETEVPVVGYIDRSYSYDLSSFFSLFGTTNGFLIDNATLVEELSLTSCIGDRTIFFHSRRKDLRAYLQDSPIGFIYLKTNQFLPARLDIPTWILDKGLLDEVLEVTLAECVVGEGYPYPLSIADQMAVITAEDRNSFLEILRRFSAEKQMNFRFSRKFISKKRFRR